MSRSKKKAQCPGLREFLRGLRLWGVGPKPYNLNPKVQVGSRAVSEEVAPFLGSRTVSLL